MLLVTYVAQFKCKRIYIDTMKDIKTHWDSVYSDPNKSQHTWSQPVPHLTLQLFDQLNLPKDAAIIDIGGGDSTLVDHLLERGYSNLTVLDISQNALMKSQCRLGEKAALVNWICGNVMDLEHEQVFQLWIDRATFHFLQTPEEINRYREVLEKSTSAESKVILATFSETGPSQCSGLPVMRYSSYSLTDVFMTCFDRKIVVRENHKTPSEAEQKFIYVSFEKRKLGEQANHYIGEDEFFSTETNPWEESNGSFCSIEQKGCCC